MQNDSGQGHSAKGLFPGQVTIAHVCEQARIPEKRPSRERAALRDRAAGALLGLAVGDAIGTTLEFTARDSYPVHTDMTGGGPFGLPCGEWTDDTAIFAFGFAKSGKANLSAVELRTYKQAAKIVLALTQAQIDTEVREERLFEVNDDAQDL